jgi:hypothetical protein
LPGDAVAVLGRRARPGRLVASGRLAVVAALGTRGAGAADGGGPAASVYRALPRDGAALAVLDLAARHAGGARGIRLAPLDDPWLRQARGC